MRARLFSLAPAPPRVPLKVTAEATFRVSLEFEALPPTTEPPKPVVVRLARVWSAAVVPPRISLPLVAVSPTTTDPVLGRRSAPVSRTKDPALMVVAPV